MQPKGREFEPRTLHSFLHGSRLLLHVAGAIDLARVLPDSAPTFGVDSPAYVATRAVMYLAALTVIGCCAFILLIATRVSHLSGSYLEVSAVVPATRKLARWATVVLAFALIGRLLAQGFMMGEGETIIILPILSDTVWGWGWLAGAAATVLIGVSLIIGVGKRYTWRAAAFGTAALAFSFAITGHAASMHNPLLFVVLDAIHVMAAGGWLGALLVVSTVGLRTVMMLPPDKRAPAAAELIGAFSTFAITCVATLLVTGSIAAYSHLHVIRALWTTPYGGALWRKLMFIGFTGLVGVFNWRYVKPRLDKAATISTLRKSAAIEIAIGVLVVIITAILVGTSPPDEEMAPPAAHYFQSSPVPLHRLPS